MRRARLADGLSMGSGPTAVALARASRSIALNCAEWTKVIEGPASVPIGPGLDMVRASNPVRRGGCSHK
eukprot:4152461-Pyramimonas_sp.AAC.1